MMKYIFKPQLFVMFAVLVAGLSACKDDEAPKNQLSAEGESYALNKGYSVLAGDAEDEDGNTLYGHYVFLTGGGLEVSNSLGFTGKGELVMFVTIGSADDIAAGTYQFGTAEAANIFGQFVFYTGLDYDNNTAENGYVATDGTIKVSKSGSRTIFNINITEFQVLDTDGDDEPVDGEGSIKGYFRGELEVIEDDDAPLRKPNSPSILGQSPIFDMLKK